jgi:AraC-like DNA-binding protein
MKAHIQKVAHSEGASFVYRVKSDPRFARGWHYHPEFELTYIQSSQGRRFVGDTIENYRSGDLVLLGPNLPHTWRSENGAAGKRGNRSKQELHRAIVIQFDRDFLGPQIYEAPEFEPVARLFGRAHKGLRIAGNTCDDVSRMMLEMKKLTRFDRLVGLLRILDVLAKGRQDVRTICKTGPPQAPEPSAHRRIDRVISHLNENYTGEISQEYVAKRMDMSPAAFSRFFRKTTGTTFVEYVGELRISHACNLLIDTDCTILDVSLRAGFNNLSNFNRKFLRFKGMTPRNYRHRHVEASG